MNKVKNPAAVALGKVSWAKRKDTLPDDYFKKMNRKGLIARRKNKKKLINH